MEQLQPLYVQLAGKNADPSGVAARPSHALYEVTADHVIADPDDRDCRARPLCGDDGLIASGDD